MLPGQELRNATVGRGRGRGQPQGTTRSGLDDDIRAGELNVAGATRCRPVSQVAARAAHGAAQVVYTTPGVASRDPEDACFSECGVMNMFFFFELAGGTRYGLHRLHPSRARLAPLISGLKCTRCAGARRVALARAPL